jgi:hypothetical protein
MVLTWKKPKEALSSPAVVQTAVQAAFCKLPGIAPRKLVPMIVLVTQNKHFTFLLFHYEKEFKKIAFLKKVYHH